MTPFSLPPGLNISITGLALCCLNRARNCWDVAFVRHADHHFTISGKKMTTSGEEEIAEVDVEVGDTVRIEVVGSGAQAESWQGTEFDRKKPGDNDEHDFRWVPDLEGDEIHGGKRMKLKPRSQHPSADPVTLVRIPQATFYALKLTSTDMVLVPVGELPEEGETLGRTADGVGAYIPYGENGVVRIIVDDAQGNQKANIELPAVTGKIHEISMRNMELPGSKVPADRISGTGRLYKGDFHVYYNVVEVSDPQGRRFELWGPPKSTEASSHNELMFSLQTDCNPSTGGKTNDLSPLIS